MKNQKLVKEICPTTTQKWIENGALLVDVREKDEVAELSFDVPDIINIPLSEFEEHFNEIPRDRDVVMVCNVGSRSLRAAGFLINHGYDPNKVVNMQYGLVRWVQKGFPTEGNVASIDSQGGACCGSTPVTVSPSCCDDNSSSKEDACC